ncbi:universal stress protein [Streptomyces sp. NPDC048595]|uniref:universal stress protein n=1 Tax=Streptomyces sp. NPDC048595 TaxID=3365576 RepID=UPI0037177BB5
MSGSVVSGSVVVGVDGTGNSVSAVLWGAAEAAARDLPLHLVHSWRSQPPSVHDTHRANDRECCGAEALHSAEAEARAARPGIAVTTEQVSADAVTALTERSGQASMLVLGSRGHSAINGFLLGSVSLHVLGSAGCPVVTVREEQAVAYAEPEIVVGVRKTGVGGEPVLDFGFTAADRHHTGLRAVRVRQPPDIGGLAPDAAGLAPEDPELVRGERKALTDALRAWRRKFPEVEVVEHMESGRVVPVLLAAASQAGLLVIGRGVRRSPMLLGPVVLALLHHSPCPVAIVPGV